MSQSSGLCSDLGDGVEGEQLDRLAVGLPHAVHDLPRADEGPLVLVDVLLIHLIGHQDDVLLVRELDQLAKVCLAEALAWGQTHGSVGGQAARKRDIDYNATRA